MSRSYKKTPIVTDGRSGVNGKKFANKTVRQYKGQIPKGSGYKKLYCSYNIHDYVSRYTWEEKKADYEALLRKFENGIIHYDPREDEYYSYNHWARYYLRK